jgi:hypothetical protein
LCLVLAVLLTLSSCASFAPAPTGLTPRSEAVCDQAPPAPVPTIPDTHPEIEAAFRETLALYRDEVTKFFAGSGCRAKVRAENAAAARALR